MQHNLICEDNDYNIFLDSRMPLSIYNKTIHHSIENKIVIKTLVLIRGQIALAFSALFCSFIVTPFSVLFII